MTGATRPALKLHLIDGTYELFRAYYGPPPAKAPDGREVGAVRGFLRSMLALLGELDAPHAAVAFDSEIESFRNALFAGYKTGEGIAPDLLAQFPLAERAAAALGLVVWPMREFEADDALATAAARWKRDGSVEQVRICSPDKDLAQCVDGTRVVLADRMRDTLIDEAGVRAKWGVSPTSMPSYLALVGDAADGIPGIPRWGAKSAAAVLAVYGTVARIPDDEESWTVSPRGASGLAAALRSHRDEVALYERLATLRTDVPLPERLPELRWQGARRHALGELCEEIGDERLLARVPRWRDE